MNNYNKYNYYYYKAHIIRYIALRYIYIDIFNIRNIDIFIFQFNIILILIIGIYLIFAYYIY